MKILCICPIGIGNYLLCYPAFAALKRMTPGAKVQLLALREGIAAIARPDPLWEKVHVFDPTKLNGNLPDVVKKVAGLRKEKFHACLNFFPSNTWHYHLLPALLGIPKRYGFNYPVAPFSKLSFLCNHKLAIDPELHDVFQNLALIGYFVNKDARSVKPDIIFPSIFSPHDLTWAKGYRAALSKNSRFIALHPGSSAEHGMDAKRWPPECFAALADKVCAAIGAEALILGSSSEQPLVQKCARAMTAVAHEVASVSIQKTAALMSLSAVSVCNDSGLMHISACQGTPTVGIFGPTDEKRNGPFGAKTLVIRKKMEGFPVWTALNVGDRSLPKGLDPQASLLALSADEAWQHMEPWLKKQC